MSVARIIIALALLAVSGCQTVSETYDRWFGGRRPALKPAELVAFTPSAALRVLWQAGVGPSERWVFFPAVTGNTVFAAGAAGEIAGFEASSGRPTVRFNAGQRLSGGVGASASLLAVGTTKGELLAFDHGGKALWKASVAGEVLAPPVIDGGIVVSRTADGRIFGIGATDGKPRWVYQRGTPALSIRSPTGVVISGGSVFSGFPGGRLASITLATGAVAWEGVVALPRGTTELERVADVIGLPVVSSGQACAVAFQGRVTCFDAARGTQTWARDMSSVAGMAADDRNLYIIDDKDAVVALERSRGASLWKQDRLSGRSVSAPLVVGRHVVVGDAQGYVHLLSRDDGAFSARIATDGSAITSAPVALDMTTFLVQTANGGLFALTLQQ